MRYFTQYHLFWLHPEVSSDRYGLNLLNQDIQHIVVGGKTV